MAKSSSGLKSQLHSKQNGCNGCLLAAIIVPALGIVVFAIVIAIPGFFISPASSQLTAPTPTLYPPGTQIILRERVSDKVGLWLFQSDCTIDVVHNWVPNGTEATLTGDICYDNGSFYKVSFSSEVRTESDIVGDNLWVSEKDMVLQ